MASRTAAVSLLFLLWAAVITQAAYAERGNYVGRILADAPVPPPESGGPVPAVLPPTVSPSSMPPPPSAPASAPVSGPSPSSSKAPSSEPVSSPPNPTLEGPASQGPASQGSTPAPSAAPAALAGRATTLVAAGCILALFSALL